MMIKFSYKLIQSNIDLKRYFETLVKMVVLFIFIPPFLLYLIPYKETLSCSKIQNICEIRSEYLFRKNIDYLPLEKLNNVIVIREANGGYSRSSVIRSYSLGFDNNLPVILGSYAFKNNAEEARDSIINFLNSDKKIFILTRYEVFWVIVFPIVVLLVFILCLMFFVKKYKELTNAS